MFFLFQDLLFDKLARRLFYLYFWGKLSVRCIIMSLHIPFHTGVSSTSAAAWWLSLLLRRDERPSCIESVRPASFCLYNRSDLKAVSWRDCVLKKKKKGGRHKGTVPKSIHLLVSSLSGEFYWLFAALLAWKFSEHPSRCFPGRMTHKWRLKTPSSAACYELPSRTNIDPLPSRQ